MSDKKNKNYHRAVISVVVLRVRFSLSVLFLGNSVTPRSRAGSWRGASNSNCRKIRETTNLFSTMPNVFPMQVLGSPPNGKYAKCGRVAIKSELHRSGRKLSGSK